MKQKNEYSQLSFIKSSLLFSLFFWHFSLNAWVDPGCWGQLKKIISDPNEQDMVYYQTQRWNKALLDLEEQPLPERRFTFKERTDHSEYAFRAKEIFLGQLSRLTHSMDHVTDQTDLFYEINYFIKQVVSEYDQKHRINIDLKRNDAVLKNYTDQMLDFARALGLKKLKLKTLRDSVFSFDDRIAQIRRSYEERFGTDLISQEAERAARYIVVGSQLFSNISDVQPKQLHALDAIALLEPLTDDALDGHFGDLAGKVDIHRAMEKITKVLNEEEVIPDNSYEEIVFDLIKTIYRGYPPKDFPEIQAMLLELHRTQLQSAKIQNSPDLAPERDEILQITFAKGGLAVRAAAHILFGKLEPEESELFYRIGAVFQLSDDLVDLKSDMASGKWTYWTHALKSRKKQGWPQTLNFFFSQHIALQNFVKHSDSQKLQNGNLASMLDLGHSIYLMSALFQKFTPRAIKKSVTQRFPLSSSNLERVVAAVLQTIKTDKKEVTSMIETFDQEIFQGWFEKYSRQLDTPLKTLSGLEGPPVYWQMMKFMHWFESGAVKLFNTKGPNGPILIFNMASFLTFHFVSRATQLQGIASFAVPFYIYAGLLLYQNELDLAARTWLYVSAFIVVLDVINTIQSNET